MILNTPHMLAHSRPRRIVGNLRGYLPMVILKIAACGMLEGRDTKNLLIALKSLLRTLIMSHVV